MSEELLDQIAKLHRKIHRNDPPPSNELECQAQIVLSSMRQLAMSLIQTHHVGLQTLELSYFYFWLRLTTLNRGFDEAIFETWSTNMETVMEPLVNTLNRFVLEVQDTGPTAPMREIGTLLDEAKDIFASFPRENPSQEEVVRQIELTNRGIFELTGELLTKEIHPSLIENTLLYYWLRSSIARSNAREDFFQKLERNWPEVVKKVDVFVRALSKQQGEQSNKNYGQESSINLTPRQRQIVILIDKQSRKIINTQKSAERIDEAILGIMPDHMAGFKHLLDTLGQRGMDRLCEEYPGFYRFAKMMERIAEGCRDGLFDDIIPR